MTFKFTKPGRGKPNLDCQKRNLRSKLQRVLNRYKPEPEVDAWIQRAMSELARQ